MKFDMNTVANVVAAGLLLYGGYMLYDGREKDLSQLEQAKFIICAVLGAVYLVAGNLEFLKSLSSKRPASARCFRPEDFEQQDFQCLVHLRNRVTEAQCKDGIETCEKLNSIIFGLHSRERLEKTNDEKTK